VYGSFELNILRIILECLQYHASLDIPQFIYLINNITIEKKYIYMYIINLTNDSISKTLVLKIYFFFNVE